MSVFIDTGLFYALQNQRASRHETARNALSAVFEGNFGSAFTSDYVYDETVTLVQSRTRSFSEARIVGNRILGRAEFPDIVELLFVSETVFDDAIDAFERYADHSLSFTDATTVALVERHDLDYVLSFDDDFDGVVERLDPGEL